VLVKEVGVGVDFVVVGDVGVFEVVYVDCFVVCVVGVYFVVFLVIDVVVVEF